MKWITKEQVKKAAESGAIPALEMSLLHHQQGRECTRGELIDALDKGDFGLMSACCACCESTKDSKSSLGNVQCHKCPLDDDNGLVGQSKRCCAGLWRKSTDAFDVFETTLKRDDFRTFQEAEQKVCDYIQQALDTAKAELAELDKPKLKHGDIGTSKLKSGIFVVTKDKDGRLGWNRSVDDSSFSLLEHEERYFENDKFVYLGNIFDDIADRGKKLDGFTLKQTSVPKVKVELVGASNVHMQGSNSWISFDNDALPEFHTKLGQVINHIKANA